MALSTGHSKKTWKFAVFLMALLGPGLLAVSAGRTEAYPGQTADLAPVPVLAYHHVVEQLPDGARTDFYVTAAQFSRQLDVLQAYGYQTISLEDFLEFRQRGEIPALPVVILTFDDGYRDFYSVAYPILKAHGFQATVFLPTGKIGEDEISRRKEDGSPAVEYLIWPEVQEMAEDGISFGSHTVNHRNLNDPGTEVSVEVNDSLAVLRSHLPEYRVPVFAFPYGVGDGIPGVIQALQDAGYRAAVDYATSGDGAADKVAGLFSSDLFDLPRRHITGSTSAVLQQKNPYPFFMRRVDPVFPLPFLELDGVRVTGESGKGLNGGLVPGQTITITVLLRNWGKANTGKLSLAVFDESGDPVVAAIAPAYQDQLLPEKALLEAAFSFAVPDTTALERYSAVLLVNDRTGLMEFFRSEPFAIGGYPVALPLVVR